MRTSRVCIARTTDLLEKTIKHIGLLVALLKRSNTNKTQFFIYDSLGDKNTQRQAGVTAHDWVRNRFDHEVILWNHTANLLSICSFENISEKSINNARTIEISRYCLVTEALPHQVSRGVRSLSSLPRLRFSSHRGKFEENKMAAYEVSPRAYAPILYQGMMAYTVGLTDLWEFC